MPVPKITIQTGDVERFLETEKTYWERFGQETLETIRDEGLRIYRQEAPRGETGKLRESLFAEIQGNRIVFGFDLRIAPYAEIIDGYGKTTSSKGRYVPAIHKRLVRPSKRNPDPSQHPGSKKIPFTDRTLTRLDVLSTLILIGGLRR